MQSYLAKAPDGKISIKKQKGHTKYYLRMEGKDRHGTYLSKKNEEKIKKYLQKSYDEKVLIQIGQEIQSLQRLLKKAPQIRGQLQEIYLSYPQDARERIEAIELPDLEYAQRWARMEYIPKRDKMEKFPFLTQQQEYVRSKSELMIADALYRRNIPYRYECPLRLYNSHVIYPDFTILNVKRRKVIYWEHRGMMDDPDYAYHTVGRLRDYQRSKIYLGRDLIITEETAHRPLGTQEIMDMICTYIEN